MKRIPAVKKDAANTPATFVMFCCVIGRISLTGCQSPGFHELALPLNSGDDRTCNIQGANRMAGAQKGCRLSLGVMGMGIRRVSATHTGVLLYVFLFMLRSICISCSAVFISCSDVIISSSAVFISSSAVLSFQQCGSYFQQCRYYFQQCCVYVQQCRFPIPCNAVPPNIAVSCREAAP